MNICTIAFVSLISELEKLNNSNKNKCEAKYNQKLSFLNIISI